MKKAILFALLCLLNVPLMDAYDTTIDPNLELVKDQRTVSYAHLLTKRDLLKKDLAHAKRYGEDSDVIAVIKDQLEIINTAIENFNSSWVVLKDDQNEENNTIENDEYLIEKIVAGCCGIILIGAVAALASYDHTADYKCTWPSLSRLQNNTAASRDAVYAFINR